MGIVQYFWYFLVTFVASQAADKPNFTFINEEDRLIRQLLKEYDIRVRPVNASSNQITVAVGLTITDLIELHEKTEVLETEAIIQQLWEDIRLKWDPARHGGVTTIHLPSDQVWKPDISLLNNADIMMERYDPLTIVIHTGAVLYIPKARLRTKCSFDLSRFPFDDQTCHISFGSWTYDSNRVNLTHFPSDNLGMNDVELKSNREWKILGVSSKRIDKSYDYGTEKYCSMKYTISFRRNPVYYRYIFILPAVLLGLLVPFQFLLPPESKERITLGSILLLAIILILVMLQEFLPESHPTVPAIASYYSWTMICITLSLLSSILVINVQARGPRRRKVPLFLRHLFLRGLKRLVCLGDDTYYPLDETETVSMRGLDRPMDSIVRQETTNQNKMERDIEEILRHVHTLTIRSTVLEARQDVRNEWHQVALVIDRLLCFIFTLTFLLYTFVLLA